MKKTSFLARVLQTAVAGTALALGLTLSAKALTLEETGRVTALLVELAPDLGPYAYDEEEADRLFDEDAASENLIAAAGFSRDSWREALAVTFSGYLATIPEDEFSRRLSQPMQRLDEAAGLSDEQKAEIRAWAEQEIAALVKLREEGARHLDAVRPHAEELDRLFNAEE